MVKHIRFSYEAVMNMPTFERRIYIGYWQEEIAEQKKEYDKIKNKSKK
jgi:hypothetical protein